MGRAWRIEYEGALYHILSRGNEQGDIFYDDDDRRQFLDTVGEMSERFAVDVFAYVLMDNHYHLLLKTRRAIYQRRCNGLAPRTRDALITATIGTVTCFRAVIKVSS